MAKGWGDRLGENISSSIILIALAWIVLSCIVFSVRHPWATDMEMMLNAGKVLTFQGIEYEEMRPREK